MSSIPFDDKSKADILSSKKIPNLVAESILQGADSIKDEKTAEQIAENMTEKKLK